MFQQEEHCVFEARMNPQSVRQCRSAEMTQCLRVLVVLLKDPGWILKHPCGCLQPSNALFWLPREQGMKIGTVVLMQAKHPYINIKRGN